MSLLEPSVEGRINELARPDFWRGQFPELSINTRLAAGPDLLQIEAPPERMERWRERLLEEGYFRDASPKIVALAETLGRAVATCKRLDVPPAFIFLFDETWELFYALHPMLRFVLGDNYKAIPAFWTWHVDPKSAESGWRPHRDRGRFALRSDGGPASLSVWIPLNEATPENGCMYLLPANRDPVYGTENEGRWQIDVSKVRALPAKPGDFLAWNQALLHWGGEASRFAATPRMSTSLEFQMGERAPFDTPLIPPFTNLNFETRLRLIAKMILQYKHMYALPPRFEALGRRLLGQ